MKVIVAGGSGFVGRQVVAELRARGHEVLVLVRGTRAAVADVETIACDLAQSALPLDRLHGADAVVNLVGIKREAGGQTFEEAHLGVTRRLIAAARELGITRFVQVSVVCSRPDPTSPYHDTKWRAEELVRASGLAATVLRPAVIYGPGDDMVSHLVRMIRFAWPFPVVGRGRSILQPVDVRDVAAAVAACLERPPAGGRTYDVVGPERFTLRQVVGIVAAGLGLRAAILPTPLAVHRLGLRVMSRLMREPLATPAQLRMLAEGLYGDGEPARRELGVVPRRFTAEAVRELAGGIPPLFGFSLRLVAGREHAAWLAQRAPWLGAALGLAALAIALPPAIGLLAPMGVWYRLALAYLLLVPTAFWGVRVGWRELFWPTPRRIALGLAGALALYAVSRAAFGLLTTALPAFAAQAETVAGWKPQVPAPAALALLAFIVTGEEVVRAAITLPLAARLGPWAAAGVAGLLFAAMHLSLGVPLLLVAAFALGGLWSALDIKTRSVVPALLCHLCWDLAVLFAAPFW